jgi:hypothetical protein
MRATKWIKMVAMVGIIFALPVLWIVFLRGESVPVNSVPQVLAAPYKNTFFDPDPNHPWNQLYGMLFIRPGWNGKLYGLDEMDPLYWDSSRYLLEAPLHQKAVSVLDGFIQSDAARLIKNPLKRALLQHMLWALFDDWATHSIDSASGQDQSIFDAERRELQIRLVKIMKSVALTDDEIKALPNNYNLEVAAKSYATDFDPSHGEQPFLPDAFFANKDWVSLNSTNYDLLAPVHVQNVAGRSAFHVLISLPTGRADTLAYLKKLHDFQPHWIYDWSKVELVIEPFEMKSEPPWANPELPQVPPLTKFALVRTANLINGEGELRSSPLTESIQIRVILTIRPHHSSGGGQSFNMFTLDQTKLMEGKGGLFAKGKSDVGFDMVFAGGRDFLQKRDERNENPEFHGESARMTSCQNCHSAPGIFSMNSYIQFFQANRTLQPPDLHEGDDAAWSSETWKTKQYTWGLLHAYWFEQN